MSAAISGRNYANIYLPTFVNELRNTTSLRYLDVEGVSDDGEIYRIAYLKEIGKPLRAHYPSNYEAQLSAKVRKLEQHIVVKDSDNVKIKLLINRAKDDLKRHQDNVAHLEKITAVLKGIGSSIHDTINTDKWTFSVRYPSENQNGGTIKIIYDVTPLKDVRNNIVHAIIVEFFPRYCFRYSYCFSPLGGSLIQSKN